MTDHPTNVPPPQMTYDTVREKKNMRFLFFVTCGIIER